MINQTKLNPWYLLIRNRRHDRQPSTTTITYTNQKQLIKILAHTLNTTTPLWNFNFVYLRGYDCLGGFNCKLSRAISAESRTWFGTIFNRSISNFTSTESPKQYYNELFSFVNGLGSLIYRNLGEWSKERTQMYTPNLQYSMTTSAWDKNQTHTISMKKMPIYI